MSSQKPPSVGLTRARVHLILVVLLVLGGLVSLALAAIGATSFASTQARDGMLPIEWHGHPGWASPAANTTIRLERDGTASLVNVPRGRDEKNTYDGREYVCFDRSDPELYSGSARWEWVSDWRLRLTFETTSLTVTAGKGGYFLPDPDWESPRFAECGGAEALWSFDQSSTVTRRERGESAREAFSSARD